MNEGDAPQAPIKGRRRRRPVRTVVLLTVAAVLIATGGVALKFRTPGQAGIALYSDGLAVSATGVESLPAGADAKYLSGTRVLDPGPEATADELAAARATADSALGWLASGSIPGAGTRFEDMARGALLDLRGLLRPGGALVAANHPYWDYSWPRDNSFAAAAFAATGHLDEARSVLGFLDRVQAPDGSFEARYLPDGSGTPDDRPAQTDGTGWVLAGLQAAEQLHRYTGDAEAAARAQQGAERLEHAITATFGKKGYPRHITGGPSDTATAFVLPPFVNQPLPGAVPAWQNSVPQMLRPAGGLAPGGSWKQDGVSWTPETAIYALTAAHLADADTAENWLAWLDEHRTGSGALPEKVLADGSPAAVAPLAWTGATVLLTLAHLDSAAQP